MAVTITNNSAVFNEGKNLLIILNDANASLTHKHEEEDFVLLFSNQKLIGINVFDFQKYFKVESGFHLVNSEVKKFFLKHFNDLVKPEDFESFFQIGQVIQIDDHSESAKLKILTVKFKKQTLQIITNVMNLKLNNHYLFALDGAILANGTKIKKTKVLKIISAGMIVSYQAIGINQEGLVDCSDYDLDQEFKF